MKYAISIIALTLLIAYVSGQETCTCKSSRFPTCLVPAGDSAPGLCSSYECEGWVCAEDGTQECYLETATFPVLNESRSSGDLFGCDIEYVQFAVPSSAGAPLGEQPTGPSSGAWSWQGPTGPLFWDQYNPECGGDAQSPVDFIIAPGIANVEPYPGAAPTYRSVATHPVSSFRETQSKGSPLYTCIDAGNCGSVTYEGVTYTLLQFHMHSPSEHTVNGVHYAHEIHFVHANAETGTFLVIGVMYDTATDSNPQFDILFEDVAATDKIVSGVNPALIYNPDATFYEYKGSFTTPPCTEAVTFLIQDTVSSITPEQYMKYWDLVKYPGNSRPVQELNGRPIKSALAPQ